MVSKFRYHSSRMVTKPRNCDFNIKGLELEIYSRDEDVYNSVDDVLYDLIQMNVLTNPNNIDEEKEHHIAIEQDGSVDSELIFRASGNKKLLEGVKVLHNYLHEVCDNTKSTSCHIHINRKYLAKRDIYSWDIIRATEVLYPILFKISGRSNDSAYDWARSYLSTYYGVDYNGYDSIFKRCKKVDYIDIDEYLDECENERYFAINTNPFDTIELRLFSNYYNFDYNYIKLYLETVDFIIELADYMKNKNYEEEYDNVMEKIKDFFSKRNYKFAWNSHSLYKFFMTKEEIRELNLKQNLQTVKRNLEGIKKEYLILHESEFTKEYVNQRESNLLMRIIRNLRNFENNVGEIPLVRFRTTENIIDIINNINKIMEETYE